MQPFYRLMLVTDQHLPLPEYIQFVQRCVAGGVSSVQLRDKNASLLQRQTLGRQLRATLPAHIPLIVNDSLALATSLDAQGVHLGQSDGDIVPVRQTLGVSRYIGQSVTTMRELQQANRLPLDYIGVGPIFPTRAKPTATVGLKVLAQITQQAAHPVIAIGGITLANAKQVLDTGVAGLACISLLHQAATPAALSSTLNHLTHLLAEQQYV